MKRFTPFFLLLVVLAAGAAWFYRLSLVPRLEPRPAQVQTPLPSVASIAAHSLLAPGNKTPQQQAALPAVPALPQARPPSRTVSFQVVDGFAVAFGDVILGKPEDERVTSGHYDLPLPNMWENPIPFAIEANVPRPERIHEALRHLETRTGVRFVPYDNQRDAVVFQNAEKHCLSMLGRQGGLQPVRLSPRCGWPEITHELMHTLGFVHEQSRPDRDQYVKVVWDQIEDSYRDQFEMLPLEFMGPVRDTPFDYASLMLYEPTAFAKREGARTLESRTATPIQPSRQGLSEQDGLRVRRLFRLD